MNPEATRKGAEGLRVKAVVLLVICADGATRAVKMKPVLAAKLVSTAKHVLGGRLVIDPTPLKLILAAPPAAKPIPWWCFWREGTGPEGP